MNNLDSYDRQKIYYVVGKSRLQNCNSWLTYPLKTELPNILVLPEICPVN